MNPLEDPFASMTASTAACSFTTPCLLVSGMLWLALIFFAARNQRSPDAGVTPSVLMRNRWKVMIFLAMAIGLTAALPVAIGDSQHALWSAIAWEICGAAIIALWTLGFALAIAKHVHEGNHPHKNESAEEQIGRYRVNPATGYRMRGSIDSAGYTYGTGRDSFEHRSRNDDI